MKLILALIATVGLAASATADLPPLDDCYATIATDSVGLCLLNCPGGDGNFLTQMYDGFGAELDGSITLYMLDDNLNPVVNYPAEDLWLESNLGGLVFPGGGTIADHNTDAGGMTHWQDPLMAGGFSGPGEGLVVYIAGSPLNQPPFDVRFNSPDIDGNLVVNLSDVTFFVGGYFGVYGIQQDFVRDGALNLADVVVLAQHAGHQ